MRRNLVAVAALAALALGGLTTGCRKLEARDNLNKGVQAFRNAKYSDSVQFFQRAVELDPAYPTARLYLASAYLSQYIPGAESPENTAFAKNASEQFLKVLEANPKDATAIESMAALQLQEAQGISNLDEKFKKLDEGRVWYQKLTEVDPNKKEAFYSLGFITWAKWYPALMGARAKLGMKPEDKGPIKDKKVKAELTERYLPMVNEGIADLEKALKIDKEYDDAMAYMNLLWRERADLADTPAQYAKEIEVADNWVQKTLETKKIKAERAPKTGGITVEGADEKK
jgi:tetratricopeptide (TPR) repeat protein